MSKTFNANGLNFDDSSIPSFDQLGKFDSASATILKIIETDTSASQKYTANEFGILKIVETEIETESYSQYVDLMRYVPEKFRSSVALQQFMAEAGLMVGSWLGDINDLSLLIDPWNVNQQYITYLADLIGFKFITTSSTTFPQIQRQLLQAIPWYKMKGTYQAYKYIGYALGLNLNLYDMYTQDYINFIAEPWYAGNVGSLPPDATLNNPPFITTGVGIGNTLLTDGSFTLWTSSSVLTDWQTGGESGDVLAKESTIVYTGSTYSAKLYNSSGTTSSIRPLDSLLSNNYATYKGQTITYSCWVNTTWNNVLINIFDGVSSVNSPTHPGDGQWHYLTVTSTVSNSATELLLQLININSTTPAYFDSASAYVQTGLTLTPGTKTLIVGIGLTFAANQNIAITNSTGNYMIGTLTFYNSGTGVMVVNVTNAYGSGTYASWSIPGGYFKSPHFGIQITLDQAYNYSSNFLYNWSFENWSAGINVAPDGWSFATSGSGSVSQNTEYTYNNDYSAQLVGSSGSTYISQYLQTRNPISFWQNQMLTLGCWVRSNSTSAYIQIYDGVNSNTTYHPGDGQFHFLNVTHIISSTATILATTLGITGSATAYYDDAVAILGSVISPAPYSLDSYPGPDQSYLFDGANTYNLLSTYVNMVRPVNTVPQYSLLFTGETTQDNVTYTSPGNIKVATTSVWVSSTENFDSGSDTFNSSTAFNSAITTFNAVANEFDNGQNFDYTLTSFYNSIAIWKLGTGNKGVDPSISGFTLQNIVATGNIPTPTIYSDHASYIVNVPNNITQEGISELGLYLNPGSGGTIEVGCTFPNINLVAGMQLQIIINVYFNSIPAAEIVPRWDDPSVTWDQSSGLWG